MRAFIDEHGKVRAGRIAPIARELGISRPDFDPAGWVIKALGWVELTLSGRRRRVRWRPSLLCEATAIEARRLILEGDPLAPVELIRWTGRWHAEIGDGMQAAWALGEAIGRRSECKPTWRITRRSVSDLYRDHHLSLIGELSFVSGRRIDRATAAEIVERTPSSLIGMVEQERRGRPFRYLRIGRGTPVFDHHEAFIGRDLRESSDPAFSATAVPSYEIAASSGEPVIEDIEGPIQFADGRVRDVAYRRVLIRVSGTGGGPVIVMKASTWLRPLRPHAPAAA